MCEFKSGIIFKNRVVLAPLGDESHSSLLDSLGVEDSEFNASKKFVRAELTPPNKGIIISDISKWRYRVDQDIVPEWYSNDPERYEKEFRNIVADFMSENFTEEFGYYWTNIHMDGKVWHFMYGILKEMIFGKNNNYSESNVRKYLEECKLRHDIEDKYSGKIVPFENNLLSMDGFDDYGFVTDNILSIPTFDLFRKCGNRLPLINCPYLLSTPSQTPSRNDTTLVMAVHSDGHEDFDGCNWIDYGVRPFFITES
ncbi:hypothetical protein HMPREF0490_00768 [Lachnospiraceae bacterium 6_1_37FAA]|nr:hypothetical protein HMPREF0490_00768 [Lachnospiraceae bacterium 6_1_37FAA]